MIRRALVLFLALLGALAAPERGLACPVCDYGSNDAAVFLVAFLGCFIAGMGALFVAYLKNGGLRRSDSERLAARALEVEGETVHES